MEFSGTDITVAVTFVPSLVDFDWLNYHISVKNPARGHNVEKNIVRKEKA